MSIKDDFLSAIDSTLEDEGQKMRTAMREEINASGMTNRGSLAGELRSRTEEESGGFRLTVTGVRYAPFASAIRENVSEGTRPGYWPPEQPIRRWVETKLGPPDEQVERVTYLVRRSIFQEGTPSSTSPISGEMNWAERAVERRLDPLVEALESAMAAVFEQSD